MSRSTSQNATRATARTAGVAALLVVGVMFVQAVMQSVIDAFGLLAYTASPGAVGYPPGEGAVASLVSTAVVLAFPIVPVALGVFLAFWLLVPLTADLRVGRIVLRSLAAAGIAAAMVLAVGAVSAVGGVLASAGPLFGNSFPRPDGATLVHSFASVVQSALFTFVAVAPVVVLAGVVVWLWTTKAAPGSPAPGEVTTNP